MHNTIMLGAQASFIVSIIINATLMCIMWYYYVYFNVNYKRIP